MPGLAAEDVLLVPGDYGLFEGLAADAVVFGTYRRTRTWSPELVALLTERLLGSGGTLLDVGANIGLVTIPVLERTNARALAFEPEPRNFALLRRNLERHGLQARARAYPCALADARGNAQLALCRDNSGDHRLVLGAWGRSREISVRTETLDALLDGAQLARPIAMKLDCQGAEARVLRGAARCLAQVDYLIVEYWPAGLRRMGDSAEELQSLLGDFAFGAYLPCDRPPDPLQPTAGLFASLSWIATDGSDEGFFDLLLARAR